MSDNKKAERAPWGDFPPVIRNGDLGTLQKEPEYRDAKNGDKEAAHILVKRLMRQETVDDIRTLIKDKPTKIVPVLAVEESGRNKIPLAVADNLAEHLNVKVNYDIVQASKVQRTNKGSDYRLAMNPVFDGNVKKDMSYLIVDDTLAMGGTLSSLRGYIENRQGKVLGAMVMTAHPAALDLPVKPKMLSDIERKHGKEMNNYWQKEFGYGIEELTQGEAGHLKAARDVDTIRNRISTARDEGRRTMDEATMEEQSKKNARLTVVTNNQAKAEAFRTEESKELLERYPNDKTIRDALILQTKANDFADKKISNIEDRKTFTEKVRNQIAKNIEHNKDITIQPPANQNDSDEQER